MCPPRRGSCCTTAARAPLGATSCVPWRSGGSTARSAKPTGPRDEDFFGALTEYLSDWAWLTRPVVDAVKIVGSERAPAEREMVDLLRRHEVPTGVYAPESGEGQRILARAGPDATLPVVEVLDGPPLSDPSLVEVVDQLGPPVPSARTATTW